MAREVAIREAQSRDRATEAIVIGAFEIEARLHSGAGQIRADPVASKKMDKANGRRWFCTPEEAEAAGWRRAVR